MNILLCILGWKGFPHQVLEPLLIDLSSGVVLKEPVEGVLHLRLRLITGPHQGLHVLFSQLWLAVSSAHDVILCFRDQYMYN